MAELRDRLAATVQPLIKQDMRFPDDHWASCRALNYADALIAAGVTMPAPEPKRCPKYADPTASGYVPQCCLTAGHDGRCW